MSEFIYTPPEGAIMKKIGNTTIYVVPPNKTKEEYKKIWADYCELASDILRKQGT